MNLLVAGIFVVLILFVVYVFAYKSDVYTDKIKINICKQLLNIEISNKVKCPDIDREVSGHLED